jgi:MFS family permease
MSRLSDSPGAIAASHEIRGPELRRSLRLITVAWMFGAVWLTTVSGAPITRFAQSLGATNFQFGLLTAIPFLVSLLSLPASLLIEGTGQRKRIFLVALLMNRLLWLPIALVPLWIIHWFGAAAAPHAMTLLLVLIAFMHSGQAIGGPAWVSWMADVVPDRRRSQYFARRRQWGMLTAIPAALLVGWLLDRYAGGDDPEVTMRWCAIVFIVACVFGTIDIVMFAWVPEPHKPAQPRGQIVQSLLKPLRNRQFLWFCGYAATLTFAVSFMGQFVTLYMIETVELDNKGVQMMLLVVPMATQMMLFTTWGRAADRMGKKPLLVLAGLGVAVPAFMWVFVTPGLWWLGLVAGMLGAAFWTALEIANFNLVIELSDSDRASDGAGGSAFFAVNAIVINVAGCLGGLASGEIAERFRDFAWTPIEGWRTFGVYELLFVISGIGRLASVVIFLPFVHEPEARPTVEALRFMTSNIYNNLFNAILQPLRFVGMVKDEAVEASTSPAYRKRPPGGKAG